MSQQMTKQRLEENRQKKLATIPQKYILLIQTPEKAYVLEGKKDFSEYNNRQATTTAWYEFMFSLAKHQSLTELNKKFRLSYFPPTLITPQELYGMTLQHVQDGTVCFGGRLFSHCDLSSQDTTVELLAYFDELVMVLDEEVQAILQDFNFAVYDL